MNKVGRSGGGRKSVMSSIEGLDEAFFKVIAEHTAGSPTNEQLKWTNLTRQEIAQLLTEEGITGACYSCRPTVNNAQLSPGSNPKTYNWTLRFFTPKMAPNPVLASGFT